MSTIKQRTKNITLSETVPKSNIKTVKRWNFFSCLGTDTSIKIDWAKQVLLAQTSPFREMMQSCKYN